MPTKKKTEENVIAETEPKKAEEPATPQKDVADVGDSVVTAAKDVLSKVTVPSLTPEMQTQLLNLAKGVAVASTDAALVFLNENISNVNFGRWTPLVSTLSGVVVRELRNLIHGGQLADGFRPEAIDVKLPEEKKE